MDARVTRIVGYVCGIMFAVVFAVAMLPSRRPIPPPAAPIGPCIGEAIPVDYAYSGWLQPHACAVQCEDDEPRYILYADGSATQCQRPPGCNDEGEDKGIFCTPTFSS